MACYDISDAYSETDENQILLIVILYHSAMYVYSPGFSPTHQHMFQTSTNLPYPYFQGLMGVGVNPDHPCSYVHMVCGDLTAVYSERRNKCVHVHVYI